MAPQARHQSKPTGVATLDGPVNTDHSPIMSRLCLLAAAAILFRGAGFAADAAKNDAIQPKRLLLIGQGSDGHPPTTHEFMAGVRVLDKLLARVPGIEAKVVK